MKYTLTQNALSSLSIAIEKFKSIYYESNEIEESKFDENLKICAIFLENSIELLVKAILAHNDPESIYDKPQNSPNIQEAKREVYKDNKLEDILIYIDNIKTITYKCAITKVCDNICKSEKAKKILLNLGYIRNAITHFGIVGKDEEYIITFIEVFDVIYNYLFSKIIEIDEISDYFTDDDFLVKTVHGVKPLFDRNYIYDNIIDFLDELLQEGRGWCYEVRVKNPDYKINKFLSIYSDLVNSEKFKEMLKNYGANFQYESDNIDIEIKNDNGFFDYLLATYSPFYNYTCFKGEYGNIYFVVEHSQDKILVYNDYMEMPEYNKPEFEELQWKAHIDDGICTEYELNEENLKLAFENILKNMN